MPNDPNRGRKGPAANPKPDQIKSLRHKRGLTQKEAAELIFSSWRSWQDWENGARRMHPAFWQLFRLRVADMDLKELEPGDDGGSEGCGTGGPVRRL